MARQSNIKLVQTVDNLIFYQRYSGFYIRTKPEQVNQTTATKTAGHNFGQANRLEKCMRNMLCPIIPNIKDRNMMRRFANAIYQWLNTNPLQTTIPVNQLPFITGYQYNLQSSFAERWRVPVTVSLTEEKMLQINIPAFKPKEAITTPAGTTQVTCTFIAAACNVNTATATGNCSTPIIIPYSNEIIADQNIPLNLFAAAGCLTVVAAALQYQTNNGNTVTNLCWMPAGIIDAMYN